MRLPIQAVPVVRSASRSKVARTLTLSSYGSCMASCVDSALDVTGLQACGSITSFSKFVSCAQAVLSDLDPISVAAACLGCAIGCAL